MFSKLSPAESQNLSDMLTSADRNSRQVYIEDGERANLDTAQEICRINRELRNRTRWIY